MIEDAAVQAEYGQGQLNGEPDGDRSDLGSFEDVLSEFQTDDCFSAHDGAENPALGADALTTGVRHVRVVLSR